MLDDDSLFRNGPKCLKNGINAAVAAKELIPLNKISLSKEEKELVALETIKLHQLVLTENKNENFSVRIKPSDAVEEETIEDAVACLLTTDDETIAKESWMNRKTSGYRAQKATSTIRSKVSQVEEFSNYIIIPMRKRYDTFFKSTMIAFKALRCWLRLKPSKKAPKRWVEKRHK